MRFLTAVTITLPLAACAPTELSSPITGSCEGLEGQNGWPWFEQQMDTADKPTGFEVGQRAPDFQLVDQFGDPMCLYQLSGNLVLVDASALWCAPCKEIAKHASCVADSFEGELVYLTFIGQDESYQPADFPDNTTWADENGLSVGADTPVVADGQQIFATDAWVTSYPSFLLLDRDMTVLAKGMGRPGEDAMREKAAEILGTPTDTCE